MRLLAYLWPFVVWNVYKHHSDFLAPEWDKTLPFLPWILAGLLGFILGNMIADSEDLKHRIERLETRLPR